MTHQTATELDELLACLPMTSIGLLFRQIPTIKGKAQFRKMAENHWAASPDRIKKMLNVFATERICLPGVPNWRTLKGEADFVTAKVKPTGRKYELQCCFVFHFNAQGLIDKVHEYFDMATVDGLHRLPSRRSMER